MDYDEIDCEGELVTLSKDGKDLKQLTLRELAVKAGFDIELDKLEPEE